MVLQIACHSFFVRLRINEFVDGDDVEVIANVDHALIPGEQLLLKLHPQFVNTLLYLTAHLLIVGDHIRQQIIDVRLAHFVGDQLLHRAFVNFFIDDVNQTLDSILMIIKHVLQKL